jgi:hypothetical protein
MRRKCRLKNLAESAAFFIDLASNYAELETVVGLFTTKNLKNKRIIKGLFKVSNRYQIELEQSWHEVWRFSALIC